MQTEGSVSANEHSTSYFLLQTIDECGDEFDLLFECICILYL